MDGGDKAFQLKDIIVANGGATPLQLEHLGEATSNPKPNPKPKPTAEGNSNSSSSTSDKHDTTNDERQLGALLSNPLLAPYAAQAIAAQVTAPYEAAYLKGVAQHVRKHPLESAAVAGAGVVAGIAVPEVIAAGGVVSTAVAAVSGLSAAYSAFETGKQVVKIAGAPNKEAALKATQVLGNNMADTLLGSAGGIGGGLAGKQETVKSLVSGVKETALALTVQIKNTFSDIIVPPYAVQAAGNIGGKDVIPTVHVTDRAATPAQPQNTTMLAENNGSSRAGSVHSDTASGATAPNRAVDKPETEHSADTALPENERHTEAGIQLRLGSLQTTAQPAAKLAERFNEAGTAATRLHQAHQDLTGALNEQLQLTRQVASTREEMGWLSSESEQQTALNMAVTHAQNEFNTTSQAVEVSQTKLDALRKELGQADTAKKNAEDALYIAMEKTGISKAEEDKLQDTAAEKENVHARLSQEEEQQREVLRKNRIENDRARIALEKAKKAQSAILGSTERQRRLAIINLNTRLQQEQTQLAQVQQHVEQRQQTFNEALSQLMNTAATPVAHMKAIEEVHGSQIVPAAPLEKPAAPAETISPAAMVTSTNREARWTSKRGDVILSTSPDRKRFFLDTTAGKPDTPGYGVTVTYDETGKPERVEVENRQWSLDKVTREQQQHETYQHGVAPGRNEWNTYLSAPARREIIAERSRLTNRARGYDLQRVGDNEWRDSRDGNIHHLKVESRINLQGEGTGQAEVIIADLNTPANSLLYALHDEDDSILGRQFEWSPAGDTSAPAVPVASQPDAPQPAVTAPPVVPPAAIIETRPPAGTPHLPIEAGRGAAQRMYEVPTTITPVALDDGRTVYITSLRDPNTDKIVAAGQISLKPSYEFMEREHHTLNAADLLVGTRIPVAVGDRTVEVTKTQWRVLDCLLQHPGEYVSTEQISAEMGSTKESIRETVGRIRADLNASGQNFIIGKRSRSGGYMLMPGERAVETTIPAPEAATTELPPETTTGATIVRDPNTNQIVAAGQVSLKPSYEFMEEKYHTRNIADLPFKTRVPVTVGDRTVEVSRSEWTILNCLLQHLGSYVSGRQINAETKMATKGAVRAAVTRLREELSGNVRDHSVIDASRSPSNPGYILLTESSKKES